MATPKECTVSMVGQDGQPHEAAVEAASRSMRRSRDAAMGTAVMVAPECCCRGADGRPNGYQTGDRRGKRLRISYGGFYAHDHYQDTAHAH
jgi:hypothetical protein